MRTVNYKIAIYSTALFACLALNTACKKTLDINTSPNVPSADQGTPQLVLPAALIGTVARTGGDLAILGAIWGQYATQSALSSQYRQLDAYNLDGSQLNGPYQGIFASGLKNYQFIIDKSAETGDWNYYLIGNVMKAYSAATLVDLYDKIPYSEALQGASNLNPKFDDGDAIYASLLAGIDDALGKDFAASTNTDPGTADLIFGGDMSEWMKFANTLKLKLYLRMVNAKGADAEAGIKALYTNGAEFLGSNAEIGGFTDVANLDNPMYEQNIRQLNTPDNMRASKTLVTFLQENNDPRIEYFFGSATPVSIHQGDFLSTDPTYGSAARLAQRATDPVTFISLAESYFMQAEARERYYAGDGAKALYDQGVLQSFTTMEKDGTAFVAAGGKYAYPAGTAAQKLEAIITQKWISFGYGVEYLQGYLDKNRTGYPQTSPVYSTDGAYVPGRFVVSKNSVLAPGAFPKRLVYPDVEKNRNNNTPAIVPITTPVWWGL